MSCCSGLTLANSYALSCSLTSPPPVGEGLIGRTKARKFIDHEINSLQKQAMQRKSHATLHKQIHV